MIDSPEEPVAEHINRLKHLALSKCIASIDPSKKLPANVFVGEWDSFYFFVGIVFITRSLVPAAQVMQDDESSKIVCAVDIELSKPWTKESAKPVFFDRQYSHLNWHQLIRDGWGIYEPDRFVVTSEVGNWCIFADLPNDVGVIAFRGISPEAQLEARKILWAHALEQLCAPVGGADPYDNERFAWKKELRTNYGDATKV